MVGYTHYTVTMFLLSGVLLLWHDEKLFKAAKKKKEQKAARLFGFFNIALGLAIWVGLWFLRNVLDR